jgi:uncharacterized membrane protein YgcG
MRRNLIVGLLLLAACALAAPLLAPQAHADLGAFHITRFDVDLEVLSNSDIIVEERIEVLFTEPRHGIYRDIPIRYTDPKGYQYGYDFRLLGIEDGNGNDQPVKQTRQGASVRLRIGSADRTVSGTQTYVLRYRARDVLRQFGDRDEIYWNATGHAWDTNIDAASIVVRLPANIEPQLEVHGLAGSYHDDRQNVQHQLLEPQTVRIWSTTALARRQGLTVSVAWPSGVVKFPGPWTRAWRLLSRNAILLAPFLALFYLVRRYRQHGLDPSIPPSVMVRYEPPPDVSPGTIGTLVDERVDMADITATLVDLAIRGYVTIRTDVEEQFWGLKKSNVTSFTRNPEKRVQDLLPHEQLVLDGIFAKHASPVTTEDLKEEFYLKIPGIRTALYSRLVEKGFATGSPEAVRQKTVGMGVLFGVLTGGLGMLWGVYQGAVFPVAALLPVVSGIATSILFTLFAPAMPRRTHAGVRAVSWSRGFEEFAGRVEEDRFERDAARGIYESLLPYAMALGVATKWSKKFEGIYDDKPPGWYVGPHHNMHSFSTTAFHNSLNSAMSDTGRSLASTPRSSGSSGSSGGGFSGGGGGGGGGGSW